MSRPILSVFLISILCSCTGQPENGAVPCQEFIHEHDKSEYTANAKYYCLGDSVAYFDVKGDVKIDFFDSDSVYIEFNGIKHWGGTVRYTEIFKTSFRCDTLEFVVERLILDTTDRIIEGNIGSAGIYLVYHQPFCTRPSELHALK